MEPVHLESVLKDLDFSTRFATRVLESHRAHLSADNRNLVDTFRSHRSNGHSSGAVRERSPGNDCLDKERARPKNRGDHIPEAADGVAQSSLAKRRGRPKGKKNKNSCLNGCSKDRDMATSVVPNAESQSQRQSQSPLPLSQVEADQQALILKKSRQHGVEGFALMPSYLRSRFGDRSQRSACSHPCYCPLVV